MGIGSLCILRIEYFLDKPVHTIWIPLLLLNLNAECVVVDTALHVAGYAVHLVHVPILCKRK